MDLGYLFAKMCNRYYFSCIGFFATVDMRSMVPSKFCILMIKSDAIKKF